MGPYFCVPILDRSMSGMSAILYSVRDFEVAKILFVTDSGAGAPFARLYLIPKSFVGPANDQPLTMSEPRPPSDLLPPGLWLAVRRIPPVASRFLMI